MAKKIVTDKNGNELGVLLGVNGAWKRYMDKDGLLRRARDVIVAERTKPSPVERIAAAVVEDKATGSKRARPAKSAEEKVARRCKTSAFRRFETYERVKTAAGSVSFDNGDKVARTLRGLDLDAAYDAVARALRDSGDFDSIAAAEEMLRAKYKRLNPGMQRMNLGNRLRGAIG